MICTLGFNEEAAKAYLVSNGLAFDQINPYAANWVTSNVTSTRILTNNTILIGFISILSPRSTGNCDIDVWANNIDAFSFGWVNETDAVTEVQRKMSNWFIMTREISIQPDPVYKCLVSFVGFKALVR